MNEDLNKTALGVVDDAGDRTQMAMAPQSNATQYSANVECPVCRTPNPPSETYCMDCGFLMSSAPVAAADVPEPVLLGKLVSPDGVREFPLKPGENSVGRENADILLSNNTVSRKHAKVILENGRAFVEDFGSTNGTCVDGNRLAAGDKVELKDGCDVVFGSTNLKYVAPTAQEGEEAEAVEESDVAKQPEAAEQTTETAAQPQIEAASAMVKTPVAKLISADGACSFDLYEGTNTVGRRQDANDIAVPDPYCSGRHAEFTIEGDKIKLTDVGSTNGTSVNDVKIDPNAPREILPSDRITLGQTLFSVEMAPQPAEPGTEVI